MVRFNFSRFRIDFNQRIKTRPCHFEHVKIPVLVPRIEGFHGNSHQKLAMTPIAYTLSLGGQTLSMDHMKGVGDGIAYFGLKKGPLTLFPCRKGQSRQYKSKKQAKEAFHGKLLKSHHRKGG